MYLLFNFCFEAFYTVTSSVTRFLYWATHRDQKNRRSILNIYPINKSQNSMLLLTWMLMRISRQPRMIVTPVWVRKIKNKTKKNTQIRTGCEEKNISCKKSAKHTHATRHSWVGQKRNEFNSIELSVAVKLICGAEQTKTYTSKSRPRHHCRCQRRLREQQAVDLFPTLCSRYAKHIKQHTRSTLRVCGWIPALTEVY